MLCPTLKEGGAMFGSFTDFRQGAKVEFGDLEYLSILNWILSLEKNSALALNILKEENQIQKSYESIRSYFID
jgi:hypothetical protein